GHAGDAEAGRRVCSHFAGGIRNEVLWRGCFGEGDAFSDGLFAIEEHGDSVHTQRDAAMRRCVVGQSIEEETEAATKLLLAQPQRFEEPLLNILAVNADAAGAKFVAVQNKIVALRTHFPWCGFELVQVLIDNASERVLRADPGLFRLAPFEQRKAGDPETPPLRLVGQMQRFAELQTQLSRDERSGFRAFDLFLRGNTNNEVAGLCSASLAKFVYIFCTD